MYLVVETTCVNFAPPKMLKIKRDKACYRLYDVIARNGGTTATPEPF